MSGEAGDPVTPMNDFQEWFDAEGGLRFGCTQCGNCCTGPPGAVWFTRQEGLAMAAALNLSEQAFLAQYAHKIDGHWSLIEKQIEQGFDCVFLDRVSQPGKAVCSMYHARPSQCRTWPFWPENLNSRRQWEAVKRRTPCPGMDSGKLVRPEDIRIQRDGQ
jgi:Fe-S-cluster containining protein